MPVPMAELAENQMKARHVAVRWALGQFIVMKDIEIGAELALYCRKIGQSSFSREGTTFRSFSPFVWKDGAR